MRVLVMIGALLAAAFVASSAPAAGSSPAQMTKAGWTCFLPPPFNQLAQSGLTVADVTGAGEFGPNPATNPNFTQLETGAVTVPDGRALQAASGHSDYPRWDTTTNQLYTTGYNIAAVIAGTAPIPQK